MIITLFLLVEFIVFATIYFQYFGAVDTKSLLLHDYIYVLFSFWAHYVLLFVIGCLIIYAIVKVSQKQIIKLTIISLISTLILFVFYVDTKIFSLLGLHLSRFVLEALMQDDALNQIGLSPKDMILSNWLLFVYVLPILFIKPLSRVKILSLNLNKKKIVSVLFLFALILVIDKLTYSYYYFKGSPVVFELREALPLYKTPHPYHINTVYGSLLGESSRVTFIQPLDEVEEKSINYPGDENPNEFLFQKNYNIIFVVAESLRVHDINKKNAPNFFDLVNESIRLNEHYTSGNCTHYGLFSLFYGLDSYYFHDFRMSQVQSFAFDIFNVNNYEVFASVSRTMKWYDLEKFLLGDKFDLYLPEEGTNSERDKLVTDNVLRVAEKNKASNTPYINFAYYYATHADYSYPEGYSLYTPELKGRVDFSSKSLLKKENQVKLLNRYKNAIHFTDSELGRLVQGLKDLGEWDNTILVFTGDHGEEFFEYGRFGHNSDLNEYQTKVPMLIHIPGIKKKNINKLTSHTDIMQSLIEILLEKPLTSNNFQGVNFLSEKSSPIYIGKAHYQRPIAYAILDGKKRIELNTKNKELEILSVEGFNGTDEEISKEVNSYILKLLMSHRQL